MTRTVNPPAKSGRVVRWIARPNPDTDQPGVVEMDIPKSGIRTERTRYLFRCFVPDRSMGDLAVEWTKEDGEQHHTIRLCGRWSCDCRGHEAHGHCKHADAAPKLVASL